MLSTIDNISYERILPTSPIYEYISNEWYKTSNSKTTFNYSLYDVFSINYPRIPQQNNENNKFYYYYVQNIDNIQTIIANDLIPQFGILLL